MFNKGLAKSFTVSFVVSCILTPFVIVGTVFYYLFSGISKSLFFGSIEIIKETNTKFSFQINAKILLLIAGIFIVTFLISFFARLGISKSKKAKGEV